MSNVLNCFPVQFNWRVLSKSSGWCSVLVHLFCTRAGTGVCNKLLRLGCQLPEACQVSVKDPKLMAWLHEPQLMQRDEKQIEGYTLQAQLLATPHAFHTQCL